MANWTNVNESKVKVVSHERVVDTDPEIYIKRGIYLLKVGKSQAAEEEFKKADSFAKTEEEKKETEEYLDLFNFAFRTKKYLDDTFKVVCKGAWLLLYGIFIIMGYFFVALLGAGPFAISGVTVSVMFVIDMIVGIFGATKAYAFLDLNGKYWLKLMRICIVESIKHGVIVYGIIELLTVFVNFVLRIDYSEQALLLCPIMLVVGIIQIVTVMKKNSKNK